MTERATCADPLAILDDYDFELPESSIAQTPAQERESARLLVIDRSSGRIAEPNAAHHVRDLPRWLQPGDLLVVNATRVLPAKLLGRKASGGAAEALLLGVESVLAADREGAVGPSAVPRSDAAETDYRALLKCTGRIREGLVLRFGDDARLAADVVAIHERGEVTLRFEPGVDPYECGEVPLPPYIRRRTGDRRDDRTRSDRERYQTVYARAPGAVAAPTAGLHLTRPLLDRLQERGVERAEVVLHVGAGTFRPVDAAALTSGRLHSERFELPAATVSAIENTRAAGRRVVAVGTTSARVLESRVDASGRLEPGAGWTDLFIRPGGPPFRVVDALLTNFHLPRSSLLLLVGEFMGREPLLAAYAHAIREGFRFYSYGDAMLILSDVDRVDIDRGPAATGVAR